MNCLQDTELCAIRGDSKAYLFTFKEVNEPLDLTGYTLTFTLKEQKYAPDNEAVIQKQLYIRDAEQGTAQLELTADEMNLELLSYWYDVQIEKAGEVKTALRGMLHVTYDITRGHYG